MKITRRQLRQLIQEVARRSSLPSSGVYNADEFVKWVDSKIDPARKSSLSGQGFGNEDLLSLSRLMKISKNKKKYGLGKDGFNKKKYKKLLKSNNVFLCVYDIDNDKVLFKTSNASKNIEAASVSKVCAAMAALDNNDGKLNKSGYELISKLLIYSDNSCWEKVEEIAGGKESVNKWAADNGYKIKPASSGDGNNKTNALDMCKFWRDIFNKKYLGSEEIIYITSKCETHNDRSLKYMPKNISIGGKTGTFKSANHDSCWLDYDGSYYAISVFTLLGDDANETVATLFRGLFDDYILK